MPASPLASTSSPSCVRSRTRPSNIRTSVRSGRTRIRNSVPSAPALAIGVLISSVRGRWLKKWTAPNKSSSSERPVSAGASRRSVVS